MNKSLETKLVKEFPLLYINHEESPKNTPISWGFSCSDGWYDIIYNLSQQLEDLIREWIKNNINGDCVCGCPRIAHPYSKVCNTIDKSPFQIKKQSYYPVPTLWDNLTKNYPGNKTQAIKTWARDFIENCKWQVLRRIDQNILFPLAEQGLLVKRIPCNCTEYRLNHPRAIQVKEKFGKLRFYMNYYLPEFHEIIDEAEHQSGKTCERCGNPGDLSQTKQYWISTECEECRKKYQESPQ